MGRFINVQNNFSVGELDPLIRGRMDLNQYQNALAKATNVFVQPQGGIKRRPGLKYITEIPSAAAPQNGVRMVPFEFSVTDSYMLCFVNNRIYFFKDGVLITNINASGNDYLTTTIGSSALSEMSWTQSADTMIITHQTFSPLKLVRGASDSAWTISAITFTSLPYYAFSTSTSNPAATLTPSAVSGNITLTAGSSVFNSGHVNQYIYANPQGRARIVEYTSGTVVKAIVEYPFFSTSAIASGSWTLETGYEVEWSASRGWPRCCIFHEGRLYFGGTTSRPSTVWGSKVDRYFELLVDQALDDDAVKATLDTNTYNTIVDMQSAGELLIFTTGGEYFVSQDRGQPITPATFFVRNASQNGMKPGIRAQRMPTGIVYVQRSGQSLNELTYDSENAAYMTSRISLLSSHLLKTPSRICLRKAISTTEGDQLMIVNSDDGTLAVYSILRTENVIAPTEYITDGSFIDVNVDVTDVYALVKRTFDSTDHYYVELFQDGLFTDCAFTGTSGASVSSLPHTDELLDVLRDGYYEGTKTPTAGVVTFDEAATTSYEVGLPIAVYAKTMPIEPRLSVGPRTSFKKRVLEITALMDDTQNMVLQGISLPFVQLDTGILDSPIADFTGQKQLHGLLGYSDEAAITIQQDAPLKMNLLALDYKVATSAST